MDAIPLDNIIVEDRIRIDYGDLDGLKESLRQHGTIHPICIEPQPPFYRLIAGGRRLRALKELGHQYIYHGSTYEPARPGYVLGRELSEEQLAELELEENLRRKQMSWQEECLSVAKVHRLRVVRGNPDGGRWTREQTGRLMGISLGSVSNMLWVSDQLSNRASPLWQMDGIVEALQWKLQHQQAELEAELARRQSESSKLFAASLVDDPEPNGTFTFTAKEAAQEQYLSNPHNDPDGFEAYWSAKQTAAPNTIHITPRMHRVNCLTFMRTTHIRFDHIITDPPYAIDMSNLSQENVGMSNIDQVVDEHQVEENMQLLTAFIPQAYKSLKDDGFLIMWADYEMWDFLSKECAMAGFKVQRWPIVWVKSHNCMNTAANVNFTKTTEIAIVCRKGNPQMMRLNAPSHIVAGHDEFKEQMDHPFVKPYSVWAHLIESVTYKGQLILDPFMGEGSSILSMIRLERNWFGCELKSHWYNKALENVKAEYRRTDPTAEFV